MKRTVLSILAMLALVAVPTTALAKHHGRHGDQAKTGTIKTYDAATGDLTITTNKGRDITAAVTDDDTRIQCDSSLATASSHGGGDDSSGSGSSGSGKHGNDDGADHDAGDDNGADDPADHDAGDDNGADDPANHDAGDDNGNDDPANHDAGDDNGVHHHHGDCGTDDLAAGTTIRRARIDLDADDAVWTKLKLVG